MRHNLIIGIGLLVGSLMTGCAGPGERIDLKIPAPVADKTVPAIGSATIAIQPLKTNAPTDCTSAPDITYGAGEPLQLP